MVWDDALSRLDDKQTGAIIVVAQRLHEDDLPGKLLREDGWHHLDLPAIAEVVRKSRSAMASSITARKGRRCTPNASPCRCWRRSRQRDGWSPLFGAVPAEAGTCRRRSHHRHAWLQNYEGAPKRPTGTQVVQSWDIASTTGPDSNDWSVCSTWLMIKREYYLLHVSNTWQCFVFCVYCSLLVQFGLTFCASSGCIVL